jgi:polyisoprenoid-binding protein YceI
MRKLLLALVVAAPALASEWEIDPAHASAGFSVRHMTISNVTGTLGAVTGKVTLNDQDLTKSVVTATIEVKGVETRNVKRDDHLRSPDFFDVAKFPNVAFKSTKIEKAGDKYKVTGDLTIRGVTKPVVLDATISDEVTNPFNKGKVRAISATGQLSRKDFGLTWNAPLANSGVVVSDEVKLTIDVEIDKK